MSPVSPLLILPAMASALLTVFLFIKIFQKKIPAVAYPAIDGLRGYLAFFVFLHHASLWYFYLHTNNWQEPPSHLFIHFGQTSVSLFFMITGFLFFTKLMDNKKRPVDWLHFYISRLLRLYPVYIIAMIFCILIIMNASQWNIHERAVNFFHEVLQWSAFGITGKPPVNHTFLMDRITAGVTWTLIYEWLFYSLLPITGFIFFKAKVPLLILIISAFLAFVISYYNLIHPIHFFSFGAGLLSAILAKQENFCSLIIKKIFAVLAIGCLALVIYFFESPYNLLPLSLIAITFIIIACGNNIFGLLTSRISRTLGQASYPIYLLHPIILFITFTLIINPQTITNQPLYIYWLIISICASAIISFCFAIHYLVELPCMHKVAGLTNSIRNLYNRLIRK